MEYLKPIPAAGVAIETMFHQIWPNLVGAASSKEWQLRISWQQISPERLQWQLAQKNAIGFFSCAAASVWRAVSGTSNHVTQGFNSRYEECFCYDSSPITKEQGTQNSTAILLNSKESIRFSLFKPVLHCFGQWRNANLRYGIAN